MAAVLPRGPRAEHSTSRWAVPAVSCRWSRRWCPARVGARAYAVCSLLLSSCRHHRSPRHAVPPIRRRHAAPSRCVRQRPCNIISPYLWFIFLWCAPTTHPLGCPLSPSVPPTPDSSTPIAQPRDKSEALIVGTTN